jgi:hypothetical protein
LLCLAKRLGKKKKASVHLCCTPTDSRWRYACGRNSSKRNTVEGVRRSVSLETVDPVSGSDLNSICKDKVRREGDRGVPSKERRRGYEEGNAMQGRASTDREHAKPRTNSDLCLEPPTSVFERLVQTATSDPVPVSRRWALVFFPSSSSFLSTMSSASNTSSP